MSDRPFPPPRKIAFILTSTDHGVMIVNRFDYQSTAQGTFGVGHKVLDESSYELSEISIGCFVLESRRRFFGDGVVALDCGANIGTHTIEWARQMTHWGSVIAIEAQERIFLALAGNITINNCFNARPIHAAVGETNGVMKIPTLDYLTPASFGSLELKPSAREAIGQAIDYVAASSTTTVKAITIDSLALKRLDLLKIDVEGMECDVLDGARRTIRQFLPVIIVEHFKSNRQRITGILQHYGYQTTEMGLNLLCIHQSDRTLEGFGGLVISTGPVAMAG